MEIQENRLIGVPFVPTQNCSGTTDLKYLVFHFTAGDGAQNAVDWLCNPKAKASAHIVLGRDGSLTQLVDFNVKAWHAGVSSWSGLTGMNQYSIGIEMDNAGRLTKVGSKFRSWFQKDYPADEVVYAKHKFESEPAYWHAYTAIQIERALELAQVLVSTYGLKDIIGHDDIAPGRKSDPGPAFPLQNIRSKVFGRMADVDLWEVTTDGLNIRKGPGVEFDLVSAPLSQGTKVSVLECNGKWSCVCVEGVPDAEGWVASRFIRQIG
jgi:N-acetylmuramoyl-L-alanine amidase